MSRHYQKIKDVLWYNKTYTDEIVKEIKSHSNSEIIVIYNPECLGIMNSTKDMFENTIAIKEIFKEKQINEIADAICNSNISQVVFSSIAFGWKKLIERIHEKNKNIKIKFFWHGLHADFVNRDESYFLYSVIELMDRKIAYSIAFAKESMAEFYCEKGYNSYFLPNTVKNLKTDDDIKFKKQEGKNYIGLYSAGERWEKNTYNQLSAVSLIKDAIVDVIPVTDLVKSFCNLMNITIRDENVGYLKRQDFLNRMAQNDINLYVTFRECSPVIPLESLELGIPCLTGNNHHYFKNSKLAEYLIVNSEDDIDEIAEKTRLCIENKDEIIDLYRKWKIDYDKFVANKFEEFINS